MAGYDPFMDSKSGITGGYMAEWAASTNGQPYTMDSNQFPTSIPPPPPPPPPQPMETEEPIPVHDQSGSVILGPGSKKEALLLGLGLPRLSYRQQDDLAKAKKYAMEQSIKHVLMKQTINHQQQQQKMAMYSQALSLMARVYIGSISFELREETIKNAFTPFGPIKSVNMSWDPVTGHHKGFAFLEYELPEAAQLAQEQMNGVLMGGRNIKVGGPSNVPQAQPIIDMIIDDAKKFNRVYVASIHQDLTENDVKSVFEAFGTIRLIEMPKGPAPGKHKGYAFIEYDTDQAAVDAVASMNLFDLGGQHLRVGRAITPPQAKEYIVPASNSTLPTAAAVAAAAVTAKIQAMDPTLSLPNATPQVVVGNTPPPPTGLGAQVFTVPPPGVAIPQLPTSTTTPSSTSGGGSPSVVVPQLYSIPHASSASSLSSGSPSNTQGGNSPASNSSSKRFQSPPPAAAIPPPGLVVPPPPPGVIIPPPPASIPAPPPPAPVSTSSTGSGQQQQQLNAAQSAAQTAAQRLQTSTSAASLIGNAPALTEKQQQILDFEAAQTLAAQEDLKIKGNEARNILMHKLMRRTESCVLVLKNMVGPDEVDDTLQVEVEDECSKYGQVEQVIIYQEKRSESEYVPAVVKIFVKYSMPQEADTAKNALDGRFFSGRQIKAQIYDQNLFDHQDLSG